MRLLKLVSSFLILVSLISCAQFPKLHPHLIVYQPDKSQLLCGEYEVVKQDNVCSIEYKFKQWHPIEHCNGYFSLPPEDIIALKNYQAFQCAK